MGRTSSTTSIHGVKLGAGPMCVCVCVWRARGVGSRGVAREVLRQAGGGCKWNFLDDYVDNYSCFAHKGSML